jgi:hypothetical protein
MLERGDHQVRNVFGGNPARPLSNTGKLAMNQASKQFSWSGE